MYATQAVTQLVPLAKELDENKVTPGVLGFVIFAVMACAVWLLMKSMNRHMGKVSFDEEKPATSEGAETGAAAVGSAASATPGASAASAGDPRTT